MIQDLDATSLATIRHTRKNTRLLAYDLRGKEPTLVGEYAVQLPQFPDPASTSGQTLTAEQSELHDSPKNPIAPGGVLDPAITPALYERFLDINDNTQLNRFNLHNGDPNDANDLYEKWESIAVVPVFDPSAPHDYFLFVGSDNDHTEWLHGGPGL